MFGERVARLRQAHRLTQSQLAALAGVSRQLIGSVETGRHLPRVDAAGRIAEALGTSVEALLAAGPQEVVGVGGAPVAPGIPLRLGRVGERLVAVPARVTAQGWEPADGVLGEAGLELFPGASPGVVVAGCDPALGILEWVLGGHGSPTLSVAVSTARAIEALEAGRVHAALVHGPAERLPEPAMAVECWHVAAWRVGLAAPAEATGRWWRAALTGEQPVVQRDDGAASQTAYEAAVAAAGGRRAHGPSASGHVDAADAVRRLGLPAVTIEPAAVAAGLRFHPLETHVARLWVGAEHVGEPGTTAFGEVLVSPAFRRRVEAIGGYDLTGVGTRVAA